MSRTMSRNKCLLHRTAVAVCLIFLGVGAFAQISLVDKITAQVGNHIVLLSELEAQYRYESNRAPVANPHELRCRLLEGLLVEKLLLVHAELDSVVVMDVEVEARLEDQMNQILRMMNNDEQRLESFYGQSIPQLKNRVRDDMRDQMMIQGKQQEVIASVTITPSEVIEFFETIPKDSLPLFNSEVEIAEIVATPVPNEVEKQKAYDKLADLKARIESGERFAELARIYSDDPGSARAGGDLGMLGRGMLVPEYEAAVSALEEGQMSPIVESVYGYHLIELIDRRGNNFQSRHILIKPEITQADLELAQSRLIEARELIKSDSITFGQAVQEYSDEDAPSASNAGRVRNPQTGNTFFQTNQLEPDIYFAIDTMDIGGVSEPIEFRQPSGDRFYRIIQLQGKTQPHRASLEQDYSKIQDIAKANKKNVALAEWIESKIDDTYISVESDYVGCPNFEGWNLRQSD